MLSKEELNIINNAVLDVLNPECHFVDDALLERFLTSFDNECLKAMKPTISQNLENISASLHSNLYSHYRIGFLCRFLCKFNNCFEIDEFSRDVVLPYALCINDCSAQIGAFHILKLLALSDPLYALKCENLVVHEFILTSLSIVKFQFLQRAAFEWLSLTLARLRCFTLTEEQDIKWQAIINSITLHTLPRFLLFYYSFNPIEEHFIVDPILSKLILSINPESLQDSDFIRNWIKLYDHSAFRKMQTYSDIVLLGKSINTVDFLYISSRYVLDSNSDALDYLMKNTTSVLQSKKLREQSINLLSELIDLKCTCVFGKVCNFFTNDGPLELRNIKLQCLLHLIDSSIINIDLSKDIKVIILRYLLYSLQSSLEMFNNVSYCRCASTFAKCVHWLEAFPHFYSEFESSKPQLYSPSTSEINFKSILLKSLHHDSWEVIESCCQLLSNALRNNCLFVLIDIKIVRKLLELLDNGSTYLVCAIIELLLLIFESKLEKLIDKEELRASIMKLFKSCDDAIHKSLLSILNIFALDDQRTGLISTISNDSCSVSTRKKAVTMIADNPALITEHVQLVVVDFLNHIMEMSLFQDANHVIDIISAHIDFPNTIKDSVNEGISLKTHPITNICNDIIVCKFGKLEADCY